MADPTMEFLRLLNDPSRWVVKRDVPIFKPHTRKASRTRPDGTAEQVEIVVTAADLPDIAANMQALEAKHGVVGRLTPGHIQPHLPEPMQPELFGFIRDARVGTFGPSQEPAVLVTEYLFPDKAGEREKYPYRSPEYFPEQKVIRGLALLRRDPFLDMGVVYSAPDGHCYSYAAEVPTVDQQTTQTAGPTPDEMAQMDALVPKYMQYVCQKYSLQPMGAANGTLPEPVRMQLDQMRVNYETQLTQHKAAADRLATEMAAIRYERDQERCERQVIQLEAEGYQVGDRSRMVTRLAKMTDADRQAELDHIRLCYSRVPVSRDGSDRIVPKAGTEGGTAAAEQAAKEQKALDLMRATPGLSYEAAYAKVTG